MQTIIESLKKEITGLAKKYNELATSVQFHSDETEEIKSKLTSLDSLHGKADSNDKQIKTIGKNVDECYERLDVMDSNQHRDEVEISGIPEMNSENLSEILEGIGQQLNLGNVSNSIKSAERLGSSSTSRNSLRRKQSRSVLVKFWSVKYRDEFVSKGRSFMKRTESSRDRPNHSQTFRIQNSDFKCFFNDYLSLPKKILLAQCKEYGRCVGIDKIYTRCNQIYAKRNNDSEPVKIRILDDLKQI